MANSFDALRILQTSFIQGLAEGNNGFTRSGARLVIDAPGQLRVGGISAGGLAATLSKTATSLAATDLATHEVSVSSVKKVIKHTITTEAAQSEYTIAQAGAIMSSDAGVSLNKDYFDFLEGLFSAAHPLAGAGAFQKGGAKKYIDTGLAYLQTEGGAGTQNNLLTAALSEAALDAAIQLLNKYRSDRGVPLHLGMGSNLKLVVGPKNRKLARQLIGSEVTSAALQINEVAEHVNDVIVWNWTTDEDDWFLIDADNSPVGMFVPEAPTVRMAPQSDGLFVDLVAEFQAIPFKTPHEYGIIGSNVA